jgi:hypothetical protein
MHPNRNTFALEVMVTTPKPFVERIALQASQTSLTRLKNLSLSMWKQPGIVNGLDRFLHKAAQVWRTQGVR